MKTSNHQKRSRAAATAHSRRLQPVVSRRRIDVGYYVEATYTPPKYSRWSITVPTLAEGLKLLRQCKRSREGRNRQIKMRLVESVRNAAVEQPEQLD